MRGYNSFRTDMRHASGWYAILPEPPPIKRLKGDQVADWVVVGAGVTGLAAARRLGELAPNARVLLLESYRVGYGTSGRNSGFIIDTPYLSERVGVDINRRLWRLVAAGRAELDRNIRTYGIECEWSAKGHLTSIVGPEMEESLKATVRILDSIGERYEWLDKAALAKVVGTNYYHAAVLTPGTALVNPAAMCRGLSRNLPENVEIFEETAVLRVASGLPVRIECPGASINAANVLLTTNDSVTKLGYLKGRVFPLIGCASLSRPLTEDERAEVGGESEWGITGVVTLRRTRSHRILIRHGTYCASDFHLSESLRRMVIRSHNAVLRKRYPMLERLTLEHTWAGVYCMTRNWASQFGRLDQGVFAALGYCGVGLSRGTVSGKLLAEYAVGGDSDLIRDVLALSGPGRLPPQPVFGLGINARLAWYLWRSWREM